MKLKGFLFLLMSISSCSLHADWVATNVYTLKNTDEPLYIATAIELHFESLRNFLNGMNFVFPHKIVLTHLSGHIDSMQWENDENCQVPNPEAVEKYMLTNVDYDYYWSDKPDEITHGFGHEWLMYNPCNNKSFKSNIKRTISFNNKLQTITVRQ